MKLFSFFSGKTYSEYEFATGNTRYGASEMDIAVGIARQAKGKWKFKHEHCYFPHIPISLCVGRAFDFYT